MDAAVWPASIGAIENAAALLFEAETLTATTTYDALRRPFERTAPEGSIVYTGYDRGGTISLIET